MKRKLMLIIAISSLLLLFNANGVLASPPLAFHMELYGIIGQPTGAIFTASGPAVDYGVICETGYEDNLSITWNDTSGPYRTIWAHKRFYCDDLSGTFDIKMVVQLDTTTHYTTARWRIVGGTGAYVNLKGQGSLVGIPTTPGYDITDIYDGMLH